MVVNVDKDTGRILMKLLPKLLIKLKKLKKLLMTLDAQGLALESFFQLQEIVVEGSVALGVMLNSLPMLQRLSTVFSVRLQAEYVSSNQWDSSDFSKEYAKEYGGS